MGHSGSKTWSSPRYIGTGVLIAVLLIVAKAGFEQSYWGSRIETLTFEFLQDQLLQFKSGGRLEVVVVDIHKLPPMKLLRPPDPSNPAEPVTQRGPLKLLIEEIAKLKPKVIAVDVDFSPTSRGWITNDDPEFFDTCLRISEVQGVPIFLGVYRKREATANEWLGLEKYSRMAVDLGLPWRTAKVPRWVESSISSERLHGLGYAVALAYMESGKRPLPQAPRWLEWALRSREEELLVNYSTLDQLRNERLSLTSSVCVAEFDRDFFEDKMVIIGRARSSRDKFTVPGRDKTIPGVIIHACVAYTIALEPLYEFSAAAKYSLDFVIALAIILPVAYIRWRHRGQDVSWQKSQSRFILAAIFVVFVGGILLVRLHGVMWLDFFLVIFVLPMHPSIEKYLGILGRRKRL